MEQEDLGRAVVPVMTVAEAVALPVLEADIGNGYESEGEESEFSYSDSVHYSGSEFGDDDDIEHTQLSSTEAPVAVRQSGLSQFATSERSRRITLEEATIVRLCNRNLSSINYGPHRIFFDIEVDRNFIGRVIIHMSNHCAATRNHFDQLCTGQMAMRNQLNMHLTGTKIHRFEAGKFLEAGILSPLFPESSESIYKEKPVLNPVYYDSYILIANKNINDEYGGARFLITTTTHVKHYDANHIPIGCVVFGTDVIDMITRLPRRPNGFLYPSVTIGHCGSIMKTPEEQEHCGKYEKTPKNCKNYYPYKIHDRLHKARKSEDGVVSKHNPSQ
ncbi:hypothetical protein CAEBREN_15276 [Caenorhabditis brenneri]|uniref:PPIase cyclophilin-type domain-containing protein n=1 Tax=Caenorhabditis brenneri TaxID=135651 RepID=G0MQM3_CAEBE|nr:hypothetical protein CAEBREN_15276 [Caenorhabditis brenneri]